MDVQVFDNTFLAAADLSALQFYGMIISANQTVNKGTGFTVPVIGILQNKPAAANRAARVRIFGLSKGVAGGTIAFNKPLTCDSAGKLVEASPSSAINYIVGFSMESAVASDIFDLLVVPGSVYS